jgi:O-antigen/teichoic acid export membrane protein
MLPLLVFLSVGPSILHGAYRITPLNLVWVFNAFGRVALYLVMLWWLDLGIKGALAGLLIVHGLVNVYLLIAIWRTVGMSLRPTFDRFRETFSYGWRAYIGSLTGELTINLVTLILGAILVPAQVGLFIVARTLANFANAPARAVYVPLLPRVSRSSGSEGEQIIGRVVRGVLYLSIVTTGGMLLAVPFAVPLLYGDSFDGAVVVAMILLPGVLADTLSNTMQIYFLGTGQPMMRSYLNMVRLILIVGGLAIASLDATAVAAATAVTVAGLAGLVLTSLLLVLRSPNLRVRDLWMPTIADWTYFRRAVRRRA